MMAISQASVLVGDLRSLMIWVNKASARINPMDEERCISSQSKFITLKSCEKKGQLCAIRKETEKIGESILKRVDHEPGVICNADGFYNNIGCRQVKLLLKFRNLNFQQFI